MDCPVQERPSFPDVMDELRHASLMMNPSELAGAGWAAFVDQRAFLQLFWTGAHPR
jgi:hypothetical protein